jgi:hypothetical protein
MRQRKQMLKESIAATAQKKGVQFRRINDAQGDASLALILLMPDAPAADRFGKALHAEGMGGWQLFKPDDSDYHVYYHWAPIMNQRSWSPAGGPWIHHPRKVTYTPDMCPRSLDLLGRAVNLDISPELTNTQLEEMAEAINKVLESEL